MNGLLPYKIQGCPKFGFPTTGWSFENRDFGKTYDMWENSWGGSEASRKDFISEMAEKTDPDTKIELNMKFVEIVAGQYLEIFQKFYAVLEAQEVSAK